MVRRSLSKFVRTGVTIAVVCWAFGPLRGQNGNGNGNGNAAGPCTVNGKTYKNCPPALLKQAKREAARKNAAPQKKGRERKVRGRKPGYGHEEPTGPGDGVGYRSDGWPRWRPWRRRTISLSATTPIARYRSITGAIVPGGIRKFVNTLPGLCGVSTPDPVLNQCIPLATKDTSVTFPNDPAGGSDFYRIGLKEYSKQMHSDLPATPLRGYFDASCGPHWGEASISRASDPGHEEPAGARPVQQPDRDRPEHPGRHDLHGGWGGQRRHEQRFGLLRSAPRSTSMAATRPGSATERPTSGSPLQAETVNPPPGASQKASASRTCPTWWVRRT